MKIITQINVIILCILFAMNYSIAQSSDTPAKNKRQVTIETPIGKLKIDLNKRLAKENIQAFKQEKSLKDIYETAVPLKIKVEDYKGDLKNLPINATLKKESRFNVKTGIRTSQKYVIIRPISTLKKSEKNIKETAKTKKIKRTKE